MVNKRIHLVANSDLRYDQRLKRISGSLSKAGYQVKLTGRKFEKSGSDFYSQGTQLTLWFPKGKLAYLELNIRLFFSLMKSAQEVIYSVDLDTLPASYLAAKLKGKKLVQDSHEHMAEVPEVVSRPLTRKLWHWIAGTFLPGCDLRITVSKSLATEFSRIYKVPYEVIRNVARLESEVEDFSRTDWPERFPHNGFLVYLGAVNQGRGLEEILQVLQQRNEFLLVIGEGDKFGEIKRLVQILGLADRVFLVGKVLPAEVPSLLRRAGAGLNLLRDEGLSYRYSLANKFFDYVHAGIPQICIDFPEYRNLIAEHKVGLLCKMEENSIHRALDGLMEPGLKNEFSGALEMARKKWNWQQEEKKLLELIADLFR